MVLGRDLRGANALLVCEGGAEGGEKAAGDEMGKKCLAAQCSPEVSSAANGSQELAEP